MKRIASQRITKANIIFSYLGNKRIGINYDIRRGVYEALPKLTLEDIVKFEHDNMANKPWLYLILGDEKNLDARKDCTYQARVDRRDIRILMMVRWCCGEMVTNAYLTISTPHHHNTPYFPIFFCNIRKRNVPLQKN